MRVQLARVFRKYVSPQTPVEMLKRKSDVQKICAQFGPAFRPIPEVQRKYASRPIPDETLSAILWEYKDRGKKGYDLTEQFFAMIRDQFPELPIKGPERAGKVFSWEQCLGNHPRLLGEIFKAYPNELRPVDFVICDTDGQAVLAIGLARYDSDRGGAQEDDRTGGYKSCADEILLYAKEHNLKTKVIFVNDGPGLLLGSMWNDYAKLEESWPGKIKVVTLRMVLGRITLEWLRS